MSIEPLTPYIAVPDVSVEDTEINLSADLAEVDVQEDKKLNEIPDSTESSSDSNPESLKNEAYLLLQNAFQFHRDHAWVIQSLVEREAAEDLKQTLVVET